ncbi:glyoxalase [Burkholderia sp. SRS-W-2-2016]|uniref:VOC family protein n=1 Tax=Burkholderia sp. SRS-W-2-2016 TaxID=1926878 RepID=UPI00094B1E63|nr:VOC family protein [Burkholderia sp. SRS-W-2-2016]OLL27741.1 glyoxalase [Burkholderia sp. SRS-W-2-2016]
MISHLFIGVNDFDQGFELYSALLRELGHQLKFCDRGKPWAAWMSADAPRPLLIIGEPYNGKAAHGGNGQMIALLARDRPTVDRAYAGAIACGATCEGPPALRPHYHENYYGAYFRDLDGNKLCVCCHAEP